MDNESDAVEPHITLTSLIGPPQYYGLFFGPRENQYIFLLENHLNVTTLQMRPTATCEIPMYIFLYKFTLLIWPLKAKVHS